MNCLIVGGAGYVGGALTDILQTTNHNIMVYDTLVYEEQYRKDIPFTLGDVRDYNKLKESFDWADCVIWLAAIVGDGACAIAPGVTTQINYDAIKFLVDNFKGRIIFPSSCSVYGANAGILTEESEVNPLSLYASLKLKAEELLVNSNAMIFRLGTLFGAGDSFSRPRLDLVVNTLTAKALTDHRLRIFGGEQYRPLLHVKDAAKAIADNIGTVEKGIFNLHNENMKIIDIAHEIAKLVPDATLDIVDTTFEDSRNYMVSSGKARENISFHPNIAIIDGINEVKNLIESGRLKNVSNPRYTNQGFLSNLGSYR